MCKVKYTHKLLLTLFLFCLLFPVQSIAQSYGFEWIKSYQPYYKFSIGKTATYKITASNLQTAGININSINPRKMQLFCMGKEVPIYIKGEEDNKWDAGDFIEFLGYKNDGAIDAELYANANWQPNKYNGLFTDTTVYYLTVLPDSSVQTPLRYNNFYRTDFTGLQPELYFIDTLISAPTLEYLDGPDLMNASEKYTSSEYEDGEGWASARIGWYNPLVVNFATNNLYNSGPTPVLSYKLIGASNARTLSGFNHHVKVDLSNDGSNFTNLTDQKFYGYQVLSYSPSISHANLGSTTNLRISVVNDLDVASDFTCLSYARLAYPRTFNQLKLSSFISVLHHRGAAESYLSLQVNGNPSNVVIYDLKTRKRIQAYLQSSNADFSIANDNQIHPLWIFDSTAASSVGKIQLVKFPTIDPQENYEFIIVSHPSLEPAASNYKDYRSLQFKTLKIYSDEIYDYYFYGNKHPLAVRKLVKHLLNTQPTVLPKYLLMAGRGYQNDKARFYNISSPTPEINYNKNLVPAIGVPGTDALYSSGINGDGFYAELETGRIPASTNQELQNYLDKLISYELNVDSIQLWRKNVLHISGGTNADQQNSFKSILAVNTERIKGESIGAKVKSYNKTTNAPTQADLREKLINEQNKGINLLSFLGHASLTVLDVDIGTVGELHNQNKYPFYYFSGCNVGNATEVDIETGDGINAKDYICSANKGAIGWLAHSNFTFDGFLPPIINSFYINYTQSAYGKSIGEIIKNVTSGLSNGSVITKSHNLQWVLQGDPAVHLYSPSATDYAIGTNDVFVKNSNLSSQDEFLELGFIVSNLGKTSTDSFSIEVTRKFPNNQSITYPAIRSKGIFYQDTFSLKIEMQGELALGANTFEIKIDSEDEISEITKSNNTTQVSIIIPGNGTSILFPQKDAIEGNDTIKLTVQNNNILSTTNEFILEIDTTPTYNSLYKINTGILSSGAILTYPFVPENIADSTTFYWRAKLNIPEQQGGRWVEGVFCYIKNHEQGWMQKAFERKIDLASANLLVVDTLNKKIDFSENSMVADVRANRQTHGARGFYYEGENQNPFSTQCISNGFFAILLDKRTLKMYINPRYPMNCANVINNNANPALRKLYYYGFPNTPQGQLDFQRFVDSVDAGTYMAIWSLYNNGNAQWTAQTRATFAKLGSIKIANLNNPDAAFAMVGQVGAAVGSIAEDTLTTHTIDTNAQVTTVLYGKWFTADATANLIGPAKKWHNIKYYMQPTENDGNDWDKVTVYGVRPNNTDTMFFSNVSFNQDLSIIDATKFPYLKLKYTLFDTTYRTPNQLNYWMVTYQPVAEGTISVNDGYSFYNPVLEQGDSLKFSVSFRNISKETLDSVPVYVKVLDANRIVKHEIKTVYPALAANEMIQFKRSLSTYNLDGKHSLELYFNDGEQPELTKVNNFLFKSFDVKADKINPVLDVTFDGFRIINGDFVSPKTTIRITSKDDSKFKLQNDTSSFVVYLRKPSQTDYQQVSIGSNEMQFIPASNSQNKALLEYKPLLAEEGMYSLKVLSKDASGNLSGSNFYEVDFNVTTKSSITNFYPYPNPATTNIKFVFTVTGTIPPDRLLIRIMTVSGKIVKEITQDDFGPMKIGQNISQYSWDGTDNYGDRLANGVYLYKVITRIDKEALEHRETTGDKFFSNQVGKIFLMK